MDRTLPVPELGGEMCTARPFSRRVDLIALKVYLERVISMNHSWNQKTRDDDDDDDNDEIAILPCAEKLELVLSTAPRT